VVSILSEDYGAFEPVPVSCFAINSHGFNPQRGLRSVRTSTPRRAESPLAARFNPQRGLRSVRTFYFRHITVGFQVSILSEDYGAFEPCATPTCAGPTCSGLFQSSARITERSNEYWRHTYFDISRVSILSEDYGAFERLRERRNTAR